MSDNEKPRKDDEVEREPVYYYSHEHRLSRASQTVRDFNNENYARTRLSKSLFGTKGNVFILMSILVICAMFTITSRFNSRGTSVKLGANTVELSIIREADALGLNIRKTMPKSGEFYIGAVDIAVSPIISKPEEGEEPQVFGHRIFFNPTETESFFISLPFDGDDFYAFFSTDYEQKVVRVK